MSIPAPPPARIRQRRPAGVWTYAGTLVFLGVSAVGGGVAMLSGFGPPDSWLDDIPLLDSWTIPGLVLAVLFGAGSLVTAYGVVQRPVVARLSPVQQLTRHHWSWTAGLLLGLGQLAWITLELAYLPEPSALQAVYAGVGLLLVLLSAAPSVRHHLAAPPPR